MYIIHDQSGVEYGEWNENDRSTEFNTKNSKSNLCDYSDANILVTGDITATIGDGNTDVAFKNCAPFTTCITRISYEHVNTAESIDITVSMYNLIGYKDNYSDPYGSLWQV